MLSTYIHSANRFCHLTRLIGLAALLVLFAQFRTVSTKATVYVFLNTECPISQRYSHQLANIYQRFNQQGVRFVAMFPLRTDSPKIIQQFRSDYGLPFAGQPDTDARLARQFRVRVTPEVVVMQTDGTVRYQGAIDDWYVSLGKHRPKASQNYLQNALDSLLAGHPVAQPHTDAVGCIIE